MNKRQQTLEKYVIYKQKKERVLLPKPSLLTLNLSKAEKIAKRLAEKLKTK